MTLSYDNDSELWNCRKLQVGEGSCIDHNQTFYTKNKNKRRTLDLGNLPIDDLFELALGDTVAEEDDTLGEGLVAINASFEFVVDMHANAVLITLYPSSESLRVNWDGHENLHLPSPYRPYLQ